MKNLLMSDATLEAAALFFIWLRSLACWAVRCGERQKKETAWCKSLNLQSGWGGSIFRACLDWSVCRAGMNSGEDPLIRRPSAPHQFMVVYMRGSLLPIWHPLWLKRFLAWKRSAFRATMQAVFLFWNRPSRLSSREVHFLRLWTIEWRENAKQPASTSAIHQCVIRPHHVTLL